MSARRLATAGLSLALLGWVACAASPRDAYLRDLRQHTRELRLYDVFDTTLLLRGNYLDAAFREAIATERARLTGTTEDDHAAFVERMAEDHARFHEVVFSANSLRPAARVFGDPTKGWAVRLEADGTVEPLVEVYEVRRPGSILRQLYAHHNEWSDLWIARFDKTVAAPDRVSFHVGSGWGHGSLEWTDLRARNADTGLASR